MQRACAALPAFALGICLCAALARPDAPAPSVEAAAAAAGVPLLEPAPSVNGFAYWFLDDVDRLMERSIAPGAAVVIGHRGRIVLAGGWGATDRARGAPAVSEETLWDLASVTKVTATTRAAMVLVQDGRLDLDVPLQHYLPDWLSEGAREPTLPDGCRAERDLARLREAMRTLPPLRWLH